MENKQRKMRKEGMTLPCGCPGSQSRNIQRQEAPTVETPQAQQTSRLSQWPVQIKLVPVNAPYFDGARLLIAACLLYTSGKRRLAYPIEDQTEGVYTLVRFESKPDFPELCIRDRKDTLR